MSRGLCDDLDELWNPYVLPLWQQPPARLAEQPLRRVAQRSRTDFAALLIGMGTCSECKPLAVAVKDEVT